MENDCPDLRLCLGEGDGNRTRTISLGICTIRAVTWPDLRVGVSVSDRERPLVTGVNGPANGPANRGPACVCWPCPTSPSFSIAATARPGCLADTDVTAERIEPRTWSAGRTRRPGPVPDAYPVLTSAASLSVRPRRCRQAATTSSLMSWPSVRPASSDSDQCCASVPERPAARAASRSRPGSRPLRVASGRCVSSAAAAAGCRSCRPTGPPRSACSRKIVQMCWSSASTVSTVIKVRPPCGTFVPIGRAGLLVG